VPITNPISAERTAGILEIILQLVAASMRLIGCAVGQRDCAVYSSLQQRSVHANIFVCIFAHKRFACTLVHTYRVVPKITFQPLPNYQ